MPEVLLRFRGRLDPEGFAAFARHRAARLDLRVNALEADASGANVALSGPTALLEAFEMACSLGPLDCLVLDVERDG